MSDDVPSIKNTVIRASMASVPYVGGAMEIVYSDWRAREAAKADITLNDILDATGDQVLQDRLAEDAYVDSIFVQGVQAALRTGLESKRRLLARAVSNAVLDDAKLDESWLLTEALSQLDVPHIKALDDLDKEWQSAPEPEPGKGSWGTSEVWQALHQPIKAALVRTGTGFGSLGGTTTFHSRPEKNRQQGITDFGIDLIAQLRAENPE